MQEARIRGALLVICLVCLAGSGFVLLKGHQSAQTPIVFTPPPQAAPAAAAAAPRRAASLYVDVAGAVQRPSVYRLPPNSRVMQAVMAAGGPTEGSDLEAVNLAQIVTDGQKVFIPKRSAAPQAPISAISLAPAAPRVPPPSLATVLHIKGDKADDGRHSEKISVDSGEQIGLNSATAEQLERLPGVGPSMAARILAYRQQAGGFGKIEDLTLVTGIGPKKFAKIAPFVTLN